MWTYSHQEPDEGCQQAKGQTKWKDTLKEENLNIAISTISKEW